MNLSKPTCTLALALLAASMAVSSAASLFVDNFSFEDDVAPIGGTITTPPSGWLSYNQTGAADIGSQNATSAQFSANNPLATPGDGNQFLYVNTFGNNPGGISGIYQPITDLMPNMTYTLTVAIGSRADRINTAGTISLVNGFDNTGTILATGGGLPETPNTWEDYSISFSTGADASGFLTIVLSSVAANTIQADFDNVRLEAVAVPEPSTLALIAITCGTFLTLRGWKRSAS